MGFAPSSAVRIERNWLPTGDPSPGRAAMRGPRWRRGALGATGHRVGFGASPRLSMIAAQHCVASALQALLRNQPLSKGKVCLAWSAAVGRTIDRVTTASLGPDGTLTISADDRHWAREVGRSSALITSRVNRLLGDGVVKRIEVTSRAPR